VFGAGSGYGRISIFWVMVVFAGPIIGAIINGGLPDGSNSTRGMPPIVFVGGGLTIALLVGSKLLQERVRSQEAAGPQPTKLDEFAREIGLLVETDATTKLPKLTGRRDQVWLAVHLEKKRIRIIARHNLSLPAGFSITNTGGKPVKPTGRGGVVLGRALQFAGAEGMPVVWEHPDVAGALMSVLHPWPGSSIDSQRITVEGVGMRQEDIQGCIGEIVRLVAVLKDPPTADITPPRFPGA
jgi:hypothetical protein